MKVTIDDIRVAIKNLELSQALLCIHASLRSFGCVDNGALTVIEGLRAEGCTILVPAASWGFYAVKPKPHQLPERNGGSAEAWQRYFASLTEPLPGTNRIYHPSTKEIDKGMGAIPAAVVNSPDCVRGNHPLFSFAAIGPHAHRLINQQTPLDFYGSLKALAENNGFVVLMGVDLTKATFLHYAEEVAGRIPFRRWANDSKGEPMEVAVGGCSDGFERLSPYVADIERNGQVGKSLWRVYPAAKMLTRAVSAIQATPEITHCDNAACDRCNDAILGGPILSNRPYR